MHNLSQLITNYYWERPTTTIVTIENIETIPLPDVTVCNLNGFDLDAVSSPKNKWVLRVWRGVLLTLRQCWAQPARNSFIQWSFHSKRAWLALFRSVAVIWGFVCSILRALSACGHLGIILPSGTRRLG